MATSAGTPLPSSAPRATSAGKGAPPPWEKTKVNGELCHDKHRGTPHAWLVHCAAWRPIFVQEWVRTWGSWAYLAQQWLTTASLEDMNHISKLRIPQSLVDSDPSLQKRDLRYRVAWHQYATTLRRQSLTMHPTAPGTRRSATASTPVWYTSLRQKAIQQHPADDTLRTQVNYKRKRRDKHAWGPKRASRRPATKTHKLLQGRVTIDTANALLRLLPHLPPLEGHQVREQILSMSTGPRPLGRTPAAAPGTGTLVHQAWGHPHLWLRPGRIKPPTPGHTSISQRGHADSPTGLKRQCTLGTPPCSPSVSRFGILWPGPPWP